MYLAAGKDYRARRFFAEQAYNALDAFYKGIDAWGAPLDIRTKRAELDSQVAEFDKRLREVKSYVAMADHIKTTQRQDAIKESRKTRSHVDTIANIMFKFGTPKAVGRAMAIALSIHLKKAPEDTSMTVCASYKPFELTVVDDNVPADTFSQPRGLSRAPPNQSHWHTVLSELATSERDAVQKKVDKLVEKHILPAKGTRGLCTYELAKGLQWNPMADATQPFDVIGPLQSTCAGIRCLVCAPCVTHVVLSQCADLLHWSRLHLPTARNDCFAGSPSANSTFCTPLLLKICSKFCRPRS